MENYKNFEAAVSNFAPDLMLSHEDAIGSIEISIRTEYIDMDLLKEEVKEAFSNPYFDWLKFVYSNGVLIADDTESISNEEAKKYVKSLIWNFLFPDIDAKPIA